MTLTPDDIEAQVFREKFKGYDQDEVDAFLDRVMDRLTELSKERDELVERMQSVEADARESIEAERLLKRTLITAQRTADETVAEAVASAQSTIADADARAAQIVADAEARAAHIVGDAERAAGETRAAATQQVDAQRAAAEDQLRQVRVAVGELQRFRSEYRDRVRAAVAEQLAMLDGLGDVPDVPPEMTRLAAAPLPDAAAPQAESAPQAASQQPAAQPQPAPVAEPAPSYEPSSSPSPSEPEQAPPSALDTEPAVPRWQPPLDVGDS